MSNINFEVLKSSTLIIFGMSLRDNKMSPTLIYNYKDTLNGFSFKIVNNHMYPDLIYY